MKLSHQFNSQNYFLPTDLLDDFIQQPVLEYVACEENSRQSEKGLVVPTMMSVNEF